MTSVVNSSSVRHVASSTVTSDESVLSSSDGKESRKQKRAEKEKLEMFQNACVLKEFVWSVRTHSWKAWGRTYLNDKIKTAVVKDSNVLGCLPVSWSTFFLWLASRRAVTADMSSGLNILDNYLESAVGEIPAVRGTNSQLTRAIRDERDAELKQHLVKFQKILYGKKQ